MKAKGGMSNHAEIPDSQYHGPMDTDFIDGAVSIARLLTLYGDEHLEVIEELWSHHGTDFIMLFSNDDATEYALLPIGRSHAYKTVASAISVEIDGLHAVCHAAAKGVSRAVTLKLPEKGWDRIREQFPAEAEEIEEIVDEAESPEAALLGILRHVVGAKHRLQLARVNLGKQETALMKREQHVMASAQRVEDLMAKYGAWESLNEQLALLENREKFVFEAENRLLQRAQELDTYAQELEQREANIKPSGAASRAADNPGAPADSTTTAA